MTTSSTTLSNNALYPHPFSKAYWKQAASEFRKTNVLVFAALMIALRVALKPLSIPVGPDLYINTAFFVNAYGAMVFGPVVALVGGAITDVLGYLAAPTGTYFLPFIFVEMAGSLVFALFFYRAEVTATRVILSRFCIDFFVNVVMTTPIMMLYYSLIMGRYYAIFDLARIVKNLAMFPIESVLLIVFMRAVIPATKRLGYVHSGVEKLRFTKRNVAVLVALAVVGVLAVAGYSVYSYNNTSLSADYTDDERLERNTAMNGIVRENHPELTEETVSIVESAIPHFGVPDVVYSVAVYTVDAQELEANAAEALAKDPESDYGLETLNGYSKSPARSDDALVNIGMATIVVNGDTGEVVSYADDIE